MFCPWAKGERGALKKIRTGQVVPSVGMGMRQDGKDEPTRWVGAALEFGLNTDDEQEPVEMPSRKRVAIDGARV